MSYEYNQYLDNHIANVWKAFLYIKANLDGVIQDIPGVDWDWQIRMGHDKSKLLKEEYNAYDAYFYGNDKSSETEVAFDQAFLHHIHSNPHHWQYWVLIKDDPENGNTEIVGIKMPYNYIIEMICDWWSFSWQCGDLYEMFKWYDDRKNYIKLSEKTRKHVEHILSEIKRKLDDLKELGYDLGKPDDV